MFVLSDPDTGYSDESMRFGSLKDAQDFDPYGEYVWRFEE